MKKSILLLLLIITFLGPSKGQDQITEIYNGVAHLKYDKQGFVTVNGEEYLIESNDESFRVSKINDGMEMMYEMNYPYGINIHYGHGNYNSRSGYAVDDIYLYELYTDPVFSHEIYKRNLLTGEVVKTYKYFGGNLNLVRDLDVVDHILHFEMGFGNNFATFNTETEEFLDLPFDKSMTYRSGNTYYATEFGQPGVSVYNASDESSTVMFEDENIYYATTMCDISGLKGLVFGGFDFNTRFINEDTSFLLSCYFDFIFEEAAIFDSKDNFVIFKSGNEGLSIKIIDKTTCDIVAEHHVSIGIADRIFKMFNNHSFSEEYLFLFFNYGSYVDSELILFDRTNATFDTIKTTGDLILSIDENSFYRSGDEIYFMGFNAAEPIADRNLYTIDLTTKELSVKGYNSEFGRSLAFSTSDIDDTYLLSYHSAQLKLHRFINNSNYEVKDSLLDEFNRGINHIRYLADQNYNIAFEFKDKVYFSDYIFGTQIPLEGYEVSSMKIDQFDLMGLAQKEDVTYFFTYNNLSEILLKTELEQNLDLSSSFTVNNSIFGAFSKKDKIYFDIQSESLKDIPIDDDIVSYHQSKNHVLFLSQCESQYCLTSLNNGVFKEFEFPFATEPEILSKENGGYWIYETKSNTEHILYAMDKYGVFKSKITVLGTRLPYNQENSVKGDLGAMLFYDSNTKMVKVVLQGNSGFHTYDVPYSNASSHRVIYYKAGKTLILKSEDQTDPGIYACTLGKNLKKLELNDINFPNYKLLQALHKENIISIIVDSQLFGYEIAVYDEDAQKVNFVKELNFDEEFDFTYDEYSLHSKYQLNSDEYMVTFKSVAWWDEYYNSEPYIFNVENAQMYYYPDINQRVESSDPNSFYGNSGYLYFLAKSPEDNSYQLFVDFRTITSVSQNENLNKLIDVYPNPSNDYIYLDSKADRITIFDTKGNIVFTADNYTSDERIAILDFPSGLYFLEVMSDGKRSIGRFIKP